MLNIILLSAVLILAVLVVVVALRPANFKIQRTLSIAAPAPNIFPHVNDLHKWQAWSPWEKLDPAMKKTFAGAATGVGAAYSWAGNAKAGEGCMTITESRPSELIRIKLEFLKPFKGTNATEFTFTQQGAETLVNWSMTGENNFMLKAVHLFMNMDKMVGGDFEKGLAALKAVVEAESQR